MFTRRGGRVAAASVWVDIEDGAVAVAVRCVMCAAVVRCGCGCTLCDVCYVCAAVIVRSILHIYGCRVCDRSAWSCLVS